MKEVFGTTVGVERRDEGERPHDHRGREEERGMGLLLLVRPLWMLSRSLFFRLILSAPLVVRWTKLGPRLSSGTKSIPFSNKTRRLMA